MGWGRMQAPERLGKLFAKQALSQLSYGPELFSYNNFCLCRSVPTGAIRARLGHITSVRPFRPRNRRGSVANEESRAQGLTGQPRRPQGSHPAT